MNPDVKRRMDALLSTNARMVLEVYLEESIEDACMEFMSCSDESFRVQKGKVHAYKELLNYVKSKR